MKQLLFAFTLALLAQGCVTTQTREEQRDNRNESKGPN